jgi:hypothetical protein
MGDGFRLGSWVMERLCDGAMQRGARGEGRGAKDEGKLNNTKVSHFMKSEVLKSQLTFEGKLALYSIIYGIEHS